MSRFTGKCDFYDDVYLVGDNAEEILKPTTKIYVGNAQIDNSKIENLIPYFTNVAGCIGKFEDNITYHLDQHSWIDREEAQSLSWRIRDAIDYINKHHGNGTAGGLFKEMDYMFAEDVDIMEQIISIVKEAKLWKKFTWVVEENDCSFIERVLVPEYFFNVHIKRYNEMRKYFYNWAIEHGADKCNPILTSMNLILIEAERGIA